MAENTAIEWCDHTFNPWIGCTKVSRAATGGGGCDGCYAEVSTPARVLRAKGAETWGSGAPRVRTKPATWKKPVDWNKSHAAFFAQHGRRQRVFCASLADVFDNEVPIEWRMDLFSLIADTPNLDWLILTKRIGNVMRMCSGDSLMFDMICSRVWLGATIVNQEEADRDIPKLLATPARVRFLSMEPLLGPVELRLMQYEDSEDRDPDGRIIANTRRRGLRWVIVGGESGPHARPMHPSWARSLRDQCTAAGVPFLFKQWGEWCPRGPESFGYPSVDGVPRFRMTETGQDGQDLASGGSDHVWMNRAGKKAGGRLLDGVEHNGFPEAR